jgi:predicted RNase H-like HicB family nuclease
MVTSGKRKSGAGERSGARRGAIDRPFAAAVLRRAREVVGQYQITLWFEDGQYWGRCVELECIGDGKTPDACVRATRGAAGAVGAYMLEQGEQPPLPAREGVRTEQVNVRLSVAEKVSIEGAANRWGFRGMSDYIRAAALAGMNSTKLRQAK